MRSTSGRKRQGGGAKVIALVVAGVLSASFLALAWAQGRLDAFQRPRQATGGSAAGRVIQVRARDDLQAALDAARPGDTLELEAGARFVGAFVLPVKRGDEWVTVRSSAHARLPAGGVRVAPAHAALMPKILSPGRGQAALRTEPGAHHYRFVGVEFAPVDAAAQIHHLVGLGDVGRNQDAPEEVPHHLVFDRCYLHALPGQALTRGVMLNSAHTEITNSHVSDFKIKGFDSQAVGGWNGPGPYLIENNFLEGAGENLIFGGSDPSIPNLVPSDITVRRNHFYKPLSWRAEGWSVKNLFELKSARRVVVEGNLFENNWGSAQTGEAILFTVRNQDGGAPWSTVEDVKFTNNVVKNVAGGVNILGRDYEHPSRQTKGVVVSNNLFVGVDGGRFGGRGEFLLITGGAADVTFDHNTVLHTGSIVLAGPAPHTGLRFTNNLAAHNEYGITGDSTGSGMATLSRYFPGAVVRRNLIAGARAELYPADNFYPPTLASAGFTDAAAGDYRLRAGSAYKGKGTDGKDPGCDFDALAAAMGQTAEQLFRLARPGGWSSY